MGRRREGFLTSWQLDYIRGNRKISKSRQRVEDYYILKSFDAASEQYEDFLSWTRARAKKNKPVRIPWYWNQSVGVPSYSDVLKNFCPSTGRPREVESRRRGKVSRYRGGYHPYQQLVMCPKCKAGFSIMLYVNKKLEVVAQISSLGTTVRPKGYNWSWRYAIS